MAEDSRLVSEENFTDRFDFVDRAFGGAVRDPYPAMAARRDKCPVFEGDLFSAMNGPAPHFMRLISECDRLDLAFLPIGGAFPVDPHDAVRALALLQPAVVVPIHYGTWPAIESNPREFAAMVKSQTSIRCQILKPGESVEV